jgi:Domain of unknown function (DUF4133)
MAKISYTINKGINQPVQFKGLKAQYIWYLGGGLLVLLVLFAILYIIGVNTLVCLGIIGLMGTALFMYVFRLSRVYGEHGLMKQQAKRHVPKVVKSRDRTLFVIR